MRHILESWGSGAPEAESAFLRALPRGSPYRPPYFRMDVAAQSALSRALCA